MKVVWIALAMVVACGAWAASQSVSPAPSERNGQAKSTGTADQPKDHGDVTAIAPPITIGVIQNPTSPAGEEKKSAEPTEHWWGKPDWWLVAITSILAYATWRLVTETRRLVGKTEEASTRQAKETVDALKIARESAEAAKLNAETAVALGSPKLLLSHADFGQGSAANLAAILQSPNIDIRVKNCGNTYALPKFQALVITCRESLAEIPDYRTVYPLTFPGTIMEKGDELILTIFDRPIFSAEDIEATQSGRKFIWIYGFIAYEDLLDAWHEYRFCQRLYVLPNNILAIGDDRHAPKKYTESD